MTGSLNTLALMIGDQDAFDTPATAGKALIIIEGKGSMNNVITDNRRDAHNSPWAPGHKMSVPHGMATWPQEIATIENGVGNILTSMHTESIAGGIQPEAASTTVVHRFTAPLSPKGLFQTIWAYNENNKADVLLNAINSKFSMEFGAANTPRIKMTPEYLGSIVENADATEFSGTTWASALGELAYLTGADQNKILEYSKSFLVIGTTAAQIRTYKRGMTFSSDFDVDPQEAKPAGLPTARNMQMGKDCTAQLEITSEMISTQDIIRSFQGGDGAPAGTKAYPEAWPDLLAVTFGCWGPSIEKVISASCTEVAVTGEPTNYPTPGGTYTGTTTKTYHIEVVTPGSDPTPGTFKWWSVTDEADGGTTSSETTDVNMDSDDITLEEGITISWQADFDGCSAGDEWSFVAANYRHGIKVVMGQAALLLPEEDRGGKRVLSKSVIKAAPDVGDAPYYIDLYTTDAAAYDA